jgi:hypothetical protein
MQPANSRFNPNNNQKPSQFKRKIKEEEKDSDIGFKVVDSNKVVKFGKGQTLIQKEGDTKQPLFNAQLSKDRVEKFNVK